MRKEFSFLYIFFALIFTSGLFAQNEMAKESLFIIHEDIVKPAMVGEYESASKELAAKLKEHNIQELNYNAASRDDFHYIYVSKIENMAELDSNPWKTFEEKMGKDKVEALWNRFDKCYDSHKNFIVRRLDDLSHMPASITANISNLNFRHWDFYYIQPEKREEARKIAKEWKTLYESKNIQDDGYRLSFGDLGTDMPVYVTVQFAKDAADFNAKNMKTDQALGEEGKALMQRTMALTRKFESVDGWARPDLSYVPQEAMTAK